MPNNFKINLSGNIGGTVLPTEIGLPNSAFGQCWANFVRELDGLGVKIDAANIDTAGKTIALPVAVTAAVGH